MIEEYGGGSFVVHYGKFYEEYTKHHIRSIVKERFGPKCHRVFSIVLAQKMIEQKQVGIRVMIETQFPYSYDFNFSLVHVKFHPS